MEGSKKSSGCGEGALRLGLVGEGEQLQQHKPLKLFVGASFARDSPISVGDAAHVRPLHAFCTCLCPGL